MNALKTIKNFASTLYDLHFNEMLFICIRGVLVRDNKFEFNDNKLDEWNDTIWLFEGDYNKSYDGTVDSSLYWVKNPLVKEGSAYVLPGITSLRVGKHRGRDAFVQYGKVSVLRDHSRQGTWASDHIHSASGINLHAAHELKNVGKDSAGCTVPKLLWGSPEWNNDFILRAKSSNQGTFYRLIVEPSDLALFMGTEKIDKGFIDILFKHRQQGAK